MEVKWPQIFSTHQNSSQYSNPSQFCCNLDGLIFQSDLLAQFSVDYVPLWCHVWTFPLPLLVFFSIFLWELFIIILLFWEFFTPALADSFSREYDWQQVSSGLQDSSQYFFFHFCLFDGVRFHYSQVLVVFLFSERSNSFLIWQFYYYY